MDTWSHGTKQSQTKPISPDLPLPAKPKNALTSCLIWTYATTPQNPKAKPNEPNFAQSNPPAAPAGHPHAPDTILFLSGPHYPRTLPPASHRPNRHAPCAGGFSLTNRLKSFTITPVQGRTGNEFLIWRGKRVCPEAVHVSRQQNWQRH
jgi:hypothetical protein